MPLLREYSFFQSPGSTCPPVSLSNQIDRRRPKGLGNSSLAWYIPSAARSFSRPEIEVPMPPPAIADPAGSRLSSCFRPDEQLTAWIRDIRRDLHRRPELSYLEEHTRSYLSARLTEMEIPHRTGLAGTGIVAIIEPAKGSGAESPAVGLRADMDGLPVEEKTGLSFASQTPGVMHACGHDGHMAMLLGAAALLKRNPPPGRVVLLFQPAEEAGNGAARMIEDGALDGIGAIFGGHIDRHFEVGQIAAEPGLICAYTDKFRIDVTGRGGHAARPHETVDSIVVASLLVMSIQTLVSREINPSYPTVVSVGRISGGTAANVIAGEAMLEGTIRSTHPDIRNQIINGLQRMVRATAELYNARTAINFVEGLPPVVNDPAAAALARESAAAVVGEAGVVSQLHPSLGGEDFAYYLEKIPGCLVRFGAGHPDLPNIPAHSPHFDFDEGVLPIGAAYLARVAHLALQRMHLLSGGG